MRQIIDLDDSSLGNTVSRVLAAIDADTTLQYEAVNITDAVDILIRAASDSRKEGRSCSHEFAIVTIAAVCINYLTYKKEHNV